MSFQNLTLSETEFLAAIRAGYAWTAPHHHKRRSRLSGHQKQYRTTYRVKENVISSQLLALDCDTEDERSTFYFLLQDQFIRQYAALLHETSSATPERPRTRIIFILDKPLNPETYGESLQALLFHYPFCDQSVNHAAVAFYGAQDCRYHLRDLLLPVEMLEKNILQPFRHTRALVAAQKVARRAARLSELGGRATSSADEVTAYVQRIYRQILDGLAESPAGLGYRHKHLFIAALKFGSLQAADWLSDGAQQLLGDIEGRIMDAAVQNGYVDDYGEDDTLRTMVNGMDIGRGNPWVEPVWNNKFFPQEGRRVEAWVDQRLVARGQVVGYREGVAGWEFNLDRHPRVWFAQNLLRPVEPSSPHQQNG